MTKISTIIVLLFACFIPAFAQHPEKGRDHRKMNQEVQEFKMKYLAQEMELTDQQKEEFFKLYGEMDKQKREVYKKAIEMQRKLKDNPDATEEDYQQATEAMTKANTECAEIEKNYSEKFASFLSQKQIFKMGEAEKSFRSRLEEMKQKRKQAKISEKNQKFDKPATKL